MVANRIEYNSYSPRAQTHLLLFLAPKGLKVQFDRKFSLVYGNERLTDGRWGVFSQ